MSNLGCQELCINGDLNARHQSWFDQTSNHTGNLLSSYLYSKDLFVTNLYQSPTFLCLDGSSVIDLSISMRSFANDISNQYVDDTTELFTGTPARGHLPVIIEIYLENPVITNNNQRRYNWKTC